MNTYQERQYREFALFQEHLARKRAENAPAFGATALLAVAALGVVESPHPRTEYREKAVSNDFSRELGSTALAREMMVAEAAPLNYEADVISLGYARRAGLAEAA